MYRRNQQDKRRAAKKRATYCVYILCCSDTTLYIGATNDLKKRLASHQAGMASRYTRSRLPVTLVYSERARSRGQALRREYQLKQLTRPEKLKLIASKQ